MKHHIAPLPLVLSLLAVAGCGGGAGYNNTLAELQSKMTAPEKKLDELIDDQIHNDDTKTKRKAAFDELRTAVAEARAQFDALTPPTGEAGKKFHQGFADYLKAQEEAVPLYKKMLDAADKKDFGEIGRIADPLRDVRAKRNAAAQRLPYLQKQYAKEAGLQLKK